MDILDIIIKAALGVSVKEGLSFTFEKVKSLFKKEDESIAKQLSDADYEALVTILNTIPDEMKGSEEKLREYFKNNNEIKRIEQKAIININKVASNSGPSVGVVQGDFNYNQIEKEDKPGKS